MPFPYEDLSFLLPGGLCGPEAAFPPPATMTSQGAGISGVLPSTRRGRSGARAPDRR